MTLGVVANDDVEVENGSTAIAIGHKLMKEPASLSILVALRRAMGVVVGLEGVKRVPFVILSGCVRLRV